MSDVASYRVQLRDGVTFETVRARLDRIVALGVSHLYLAPILTAAPGSTHGYDVTDPTTIDPALGGEEGFVALAEDARGRGLEIILDIVPNHMAFGLDTPWLVDVLRHGRASRFAPIFDIGWEQGPLVLPWLGEPLTTSLAERRLRLSGDDLVVGDLVLPLAPGSAAAVAESGAFDAAALDALHEAQHWRLVPWQLERDSITHRRFFSITSLIGVRVEDPAVFDLTHERIFDLVDRGLVTGLRVDHVDGLVDPSGYLARLAARLPGVPVWVEKILVDGEALPAWPVAGTTGYEVAALTARILTDPKGFSRIDALWRGATGIEGDFHAAVAEAKRAVLTDELAAELRQLCDLARAAAEASGHAAGPEMLREALVELLVAFPRYRSYITDVVDPADAALWLETAAKAAEGVRLPDTIRWVGEAIVGLPTPEARLLAHRFQQVTGALLAKAHEDTAGFRFNRFLAHNEVGANPDLPSADEAEVEVFLADRRRSWPRALNLGSSHDTKRSEDARARLLALSHAPDALTRLWHASETIPGGDRIGANHRFYALQSAVALWGEPEAEDRVAAHLVKALREAKEESYWTAPDETLERRLGAWAGTLLARWDGDPPEDIARICAIGAALSLQDLALRCLMPGMPDVYQGGEGALFQLTDPDNRRRPDWAALDALPHSGSALSRAKAGLLTACLALRRAEPALFAEGDVLWQVEGSVRRLVRRHDGRSVTASLWAGPAGEETGAGRIVWSSGADQPLGLTLSASDA